MELRDGAYATLLADQLRSGETVDVLVERAPEDVARAHQAYIAAGATIVHSPTLMTWQTRQSARQRRYSAAWDVVSDSVKSTSARAVIVVGPVGTQPHDFWSDLEIVLTLGAEQVACLTVSDVRTAHAFAEAWHDVAVAGGSGARAVLSFGIWDVASTDVSAGSRNAQWVQACHSIYERGWGTQLEIGLNCGVGLAGVEHAISDLSTAWRSPVHVAPSAGLPERRLERSAWVESMRTFAERDDVASIGGCCGTTPDWIAAL